MSSAEDRGTVADDDNVAELAQQGGAQHDDQTDSEDVAVATGPSAKDLQLVPASSSTIEVHSLLHETMYLCRICKEKSSKDASYWSLFKEFWI